ncbi:outer membrane beta-barrel protein [Marinoscillum furvescens]|uniref:Outer membrane protein beta-barrel domain-containing protein n=1 Tax=Marinoscillum furvescens DSM 4134 TaxID=1122208 RepID=A0A3D9L1F6_MARFU|nr:outer membrane beta-barrel protein [Marinoscillum furvescens]RED95567.1 hypothetical protein C7460_11716 [Marinoscillum furvescens DSM 4134]
MKNLFFTTLLTLFLGFTAQAQIPPKTNFLTGYFSYSNFNSGDQSQDSNRESLGIGIGYGRFLSENSALGIQASYSWNTLNTFYLAIAERQYKSFGDKFYGFIEFYAGASRIEDIGNQIFLGARPGISYFLNEKWAIEANLGGINVGRQFNNDGPNSNNFSIGLLNELDFSLAYYF